MEKRGGWREGSGRKRIFESDVCQGLSINLPSRVRARVIKEAERRGCSRSKVIVDILRKGTPSWPWPKNRKRKSSKS